MTTVETLTVATIAVTNIDKYNCAKARYALADDGDDTITEVNRWIDFVKDQERKI